MGKRVTLSTFDIINYSFLFLLTIIMIYPFWDVAKLSLTDSQVVNKAGFRIFPEILSLEAYKLVSRNSLLWSGYLNTIYRVLLGCSISMLLLIITAYPLSKKYFPFRTFFTFFIIFTMFFSGGLIPNYLLITNTLKINNTVWCLVLPTAINTYSMLILRNNFMALPPSLEESARIDGAGHMRILFFIFVPLSKAILMTVLLWSMVSHWNAWFDCLIYIRDTNKFVLQVILRKIVIEASPQFTMDLIDSGDVVVPASVSVRCATIIASSLPIIMVYPFIQKHFVKGVMIGSLKG